MSMGKLVYFAFLLPGVIRMAAGQEQAKPAAAGQALSVVKRICIEKFGGDSEAAAQVRELAIAALFTSKAFLITEKCEKADATMHGAVTRGKGYRSRSEGEGIRFGDRISVADSFGKAAASATGMT